MHETNDIHLFSELYDVHPQAIFWFRPLWLDDGTGIKDFEYYYSNEEGLKYLNITREQFKGLTVKNSWVLTEELRKDFFYDLERVFNTGEKSLVLVYNPILNKHTKVLRCRLRNGILNVVQDISEEKKIIQQLEEQAVKLNEQKTLLDNIMKNSSNGISVSEAVRNENGKIVDAITIMANDAAIKYIGYPKQDFLNKKATEMDPSIIESDYFKACVNTLKTGTPFMMQYLVQSTARWLELTVSRLDFNRLIHVFSDITVVKEVQLELEKAAHTLKSVFDSAQTGMFTFAPEYNELGEIVDFRFVMVNSTLAEYAGLKVEDMEGQPGVSWFSGYLANGEFDLYKNCFLTGEPQQKELFYRFNERDFYMDLQCVKMGEQLLVTLTDHTSLRKSQLELEQTIKALELSNRHLEDFAHAASHDLKEPLRKIRTFTDRLRSMLEDRLMEPEMAIFKRIEVSAERMQLLVDDLLEFSHVSETQHELEEIDLNEKVERVLADLELPIEEKKAEFRIDKLPVIKGLRRQIQQLFQNLIGNALKYSKTGVPPRIEIRYKIIKGSQAEIDLPSDSREKPFHFFEVIDNGIGFEQEYAEQIFKMFQRLHGKTEYAGTGIGLSIARKVVENHNGYIWARGEEGKGARFKVLLPA